MKSGHTILSGLLGCSLWLLGGMAFAAPELSDLESWDDLPALKVSKSLPADSKPSDFYLKAGRSSEPKDQDFDAREKTTPAFGTSSSKINDSTPPYLKNGDDASDSSFSIAPLSSKQDNLEPVAPVNSIRSAIDEPKEKSSVEPSSEPDTKSEEQPDETPSKSLGFNEKNVTDSASDTTISEARLTTTSIFVSAFLVSVIFLVLWYQKQLKGRLRANQGLPIETLGQTWLDGQTKIIILRIGSKVLILAKSPSFCTTLDTITDPEEVNLLTLGSGTAGKEDFSKLLTQIKNQTGFGKKNRDIPHESEIRSELDQLKQQLGSIGQPKS